MACLFLWKIILDFSGLGEFASSFTTAGMALQIRDAILLNIKLILKKLLA
jgi:hypothetical protein